MTIKIMMTWDIEPEHEQDYFDFILTEFIPGIQRLGLQPAEAWATIYGDYPQIQVGLLAADLDIARRFLDSPGWRTLQEKLFQYVRNYRHRVVRARSGFQFF
jgi:hypothetical protein